METNSEIVTREGLIIFKRIFSKHLGFLGMLTEDKEEVEIILKDNNSIYIKPTKLGHHCKVKGYFMISNLGRPQLYPTSYESFAKDDLSLYEKTRRNLLNTDYKPNEQRALCKNYKLKNKCDTLNCKFRHHLLEGETEKLEKLKKKGEIAFNLAHEDDPIDKDSKINKHQRHRLFAQFLVDTFGDSLKNGYVLDIAGGKGMISYELTLTFGIKCIIVDPRETSLPKRLIKIMKENNVNLSHIKDYFNEEFDESIINNASLIIGMHPDEATIDIVRTALKFKKSFAVVPCCVFPTLFPDRFLSSGEQVVDYSQLIKYISEMIGEHEVHHLNIQGRNKVIYKKF
jgi:hypothetical protein